MLITREKHMRVIVSAQEFTCVRSRFCGQATKGVRVDALAQTGDEGRGQLR